MDLTEMEGPQFANENIQEAIKCPICLDVGLPPLFMCTEGHFACSLCRERMSKSTPRVDTCGICRSPYTTTRNFAIEHLLSEVIVPCKNHMCPKRSKVSEMKEHLEECEYRSISCHFGFKCPMPVEWEVYLEHMEKEHGVQKLRMKQDGNIASCFADVRLPTNYIRNDFCELIQTKRVIWDPFILVNEDGEKFIMHAVSEYSNLFIWITAFNTDHTHFYASVAITGDPEKDFSDVPRVTYQLGVAPLHSKFDSVQNSSFSAVVPLVSVLYWSNFEDDTSESFMDIRVVLTDSRLEIAKPGRRRKSDSNALFHSSSDFECYLERVYSPFGIKL